jgi:predicted DNA-binding transcriptional regulator YafY
MGRRPKRYSQAERLTRIIRALSSRNCTVNDLAREFAVTRRQVYRDLARIEEEGHPLVQSHGAGERTWRLPLGYKGLPPITLTPLELMSLYLAKSNLEYLAGTPFMDDLDRVIGKLISGLPQKTINHLERIEPVFLPFPRPLRRYDKQKDLLSTLQKALLFQRTVVIRHRTPGSHDTTEHRVDPYALRLYKNGLYLFTYSHRAKAHRLFAIERIRGAELTEDSFTLSRNFSPAKLNESFGLVDDPAQTIRIRFTADVAYFLKEREWHPTQSIEELDDGGVIFTMHAGGLDEIVSWVLSWGANAEVLAPPALIEAVLDHLTAAREHYIAKNR